MDNTHVVLNPSNILMSHNLKMKHSKMLFTKELWLRQKEVKFEVIPNNARKAVPKARKESLSIDQFTL